MYQKDKSDEFGDHETSAKIMSASSAYECYQLGLSVKHYDHKLKLTKVRKVMYDIQILKYIQNPKYMEERKATGKTHIIEASAQHKTWGVGVSLNSRDLFNKDKWSGDNWMGKILMEIRDDN